MELAILFGSLAGNDVDIAVSRIDKYFELLLALQDYLDVEKIGLVMVDKDTNCYLVHEVSSGTQ